MEKVNANTVLIILDNGHGSNTQGKSSPDRRLREYKWTREIVDMIIKELTKLGIKSVKLVPEETDVSLKERVRRANKYYIENNKKAILISVHCNAAGADDTWHTANGWSVFVAQNASSNSKRLADSICDAVIADKIKVRKPAPNQKYWVQSLAICRDTNCPAVLTENMFQDNKEDVEFLLSNEGKKKIVDAHVKGILSYLNGK